MNYETQTSTTVDPGAAASARTKAMLVHLYTASTMVVLMVSTAFLLNNQLTAALFTMLLSIVIDATDGSLARRFKVKQHVPEYDGRTMDDIIDYVSYVFLPAIFMLKAQMLLEPAIIFCCLPLIASAFGFSRVDAKLDADGFFVGFPSYWNIVIGYFYLTGSPPWLNTLIIVFLTALVFVPTRYIYITRFPRLRRAHLAGATLSGITMLAALFVGGDLRLTLVLISLIYPVIYTVYSLILDRRARRAVR
ncbi:MAG: CDP-alcohol phosphatidyltransferase family protein [Chloroflexales bacterium]